MKKPIIAQNALVTYNEELGQDITDSYKIAKKFQMTPANAKRNLALTIKIYIELKSHLSNLKGEINTQLIENLDIEKEIIPTKLKTDRGVIIDGYYLTEMGYTLALQHFSTPKLQKTKMLIANARLEFAQAFFLMRNIIKNQPQDTSEFKQVDTSKFGKLSKKNKLHGRTEEVRGYFRSNKNSELSKLFGERTRLKNRLGGLMDIEILEEIKELDHKITTLQKTLIQEQLSEEVLNKKLLS